MIARIRHALLRARRVGYASGFRAGLEESASVALPPELIQSFHRLDAALEYGSMADVRRERDAQHTLLERLIKGEVEHV